MPRILIASLLLLISLFQLAIAEPAGGELLLGDFEDGWDDDWKHKRLYRPRTDYEATELEGETVLGARSKRSASIYYRPLDIREPDAGWISWRWRVERSLTENTDETEKKGDDYAARVFVIFDPGLLGRNVRSLCYVWAGNEPVGSNYPNPYAENVRTVVLQSGDGMAGEWVTEKRDVVADFEEAFGETPPGITAVAIMSGTDNTRTEVRAWFDDIALSIHSRVSEFTGFEGERPTE
jgi:hypothetical protein